MSESVTPLLLPQSVIPTEVTSAQTLIPYLAGFFDGEGAVSVKISSSYNGNWYYSIKAQVCNTDTDVIELIHRNFGGKINRIGRPNGWKDINYVDWYGKEATRVLRIMLPYLVVKKRIAEMAIAFWSECFAGRAKGCPVTEADKVARDYYRRTIDSMQMRQRRSAKYV